MNGQRGGDQHRARLDAYRKARRTAWGSRAGGFSEPLLELLTALLELSLVGEFRNRDAGHRAAAHLSQRGAKATPNDRRISDHMSPRDPWKPPPVELVAAFVDLYLERTGDDEVIVNRQINQLMWAAEGAYSEERSRRSARRRMPTSDQVDELRTRVSTLTERVERLCRAAEAAQAVTEQQQTRHAAEIDRISTELDDARANLREAERQRDLWCEQAVLVAIERDELQGQVVQERQAKAAAEQVRLRLVATSDQRDAELAELRQVGTHIPRPVRQPPSADFMPRRLGYGWSERARYRSSRYRPEAYEKVHQLVGGLALMAFLPTLVLVSLDDDHLIANPIGLEFYIICPISLIFDTFLLHIGARFVKTSARPGPIVHVSANVIYLEGVGTYLWENITKVEWARMRRVQERVWCAPCCSFEMKNTVAAEQSRLTLYTANGRSLATIEGSRINWGKFVAAASTAASHVTFSETPIPPHTACDPDEFVQVYSY
jgi:hypothetical protein